MIPPTRLALLSTLAETHAESIRYNFKALAALVAHLAPDLLCIELPQSQWEAGVLAQSPPEVQRSLLPTAELTDTVIVPIAPDVRQFNDFAPRRGWRGQLSRRLYAALQKAQRTANSAEAIHAAMFQNVCHTLCLLNEINWTAEARRAWHAQNHAMLENILHAAQRDPGRRILVAVQCQRLHWLEPRLKKMPEIELVNYQDL